MKIGWTYFGKLYKWLDNKELFSKPWKTDFLVFCIDTYISVWIQMSWNLFWYFLSTLYRYTQALYRYKSFYTKTECSIWFETCLHVSIHVYMFWKTSKLHMIRSMLACLDTYQSRFQDSDVCIDTSRVCIDTKVKIFKIERWSRALYRYKQSFVSIHLLKIMPKFAHSIFSLNSNVWIPL